MNNKEAHAIFLVCQHVLGKPPYRNPPAWPAPSDQEARDALATLAERAYTHLQTGYSGTRVLELWDERPGAAAAPAPDDLAERLREQLGYLLAQLADTATTLREPDSQPELALEMLDELLEEERCRSCGCTHTSPCESEEEGPCGWAEPGLCTACVS